MNAAEFPIEGRLLGVDYGAVRIGVSICDPSQTLASPLANYDRRSKELDAKYFRTLIQEEGVVGIVVGLPVHNSGEESQKSLEAREFGAWLTLQTELPVRFYDERFSTAHAQRILGDAKLTKRQRKRRLDMLAAQIILAAYLESFDGQEHSGSI